MVNGTLIVHLGESRGLFLACLYHENTFKFTMETKIQCRNEAGTKIWSIHNNWIVGNSKKIGRFREWNQYLYDEMSDKCF